jgi:hypothetical protein
MTSTSAELIEARRAERAAVLAEREDELGAARARLEVAEANYTAEKAAWNRLVADTTCGVSRGDWIPAATHAWLHVEAREPLKRAEGERGAARALARSLEERVTSLRGEVAQLDESLTQLKVAPLLPTRAEVPKRRPAIVEFSDVELPARSAAP